MSETVTAIMFNGVTDRCGCTSLTIALVEVLKNFGYKAIGIELNKNEFDTIRTDYLFSIRGDNLGTFLLKNVEEDFAIIDGNGWNDMEFVDYPFLILSLSKLQISKFKMKYNLSEIKNKQLVLNKSCLNSHQVSRFELENGFQFELVLPYFNEYDMGNTIEALTPILSYLNLTKRKKWRLF